MIPINTNKKDGSQMTSASNVIWDGPDIPCIKLCKGDTIDKVTYHLANLLCKKIQDLDTDNYDLTCLEIEGCDKITFQQLIQILIDRSCDTDTPPPSGGGNGGSTPPQGNCCDDLVLPVVVKYTEQGGLSGQQIPLLEGVWTILPFTNYNVPPGGDGVYEVMVMLNVVGVDSALSGTINVNGGSSPNHNFYAGVTMNSAVDDENVAPHYSVPVMAFASNMNLQAGDNVRVEVQGVLGPTGNGATPTILSGRIKITKLS